MTAKTVTLSPLGVKKRRGSCGRSPSAYDLACEGADGSGPGPSDIAEAMLL